MTRYLSVNEMTVQPVSKYPNSILFCASPNPYPKADQKRSDSHYRTSRLIIEPIHSRVLNQYRRPFKPTTVQRRLPSCRLNPIHLRQPHTPRRSRQSLPIYSPVALRSGVRIGWCGYIAHAGPVQQPVGAREIPRRHAGGGEVVVADDR